VVVASAAAVGAATAHGSRPAPDAAWTSFGRDAQIRCICDGPGSADYVVQELLPYAFTLRRP